jgi:hypothetical protein
LPPWGRPDRAGCCARIAAAGPRAVVWEEADVTDEQAADHRVLAEPDRGAPVPADPRTGPSQPPGNPAITPPTCAMAYQRVVRSPPVGGRRERTPARSDCSLTDPAFQGTAFYVHPSETSLDAQANSRKTKLHQARSSAAGRFAAPGMRVSSVETSKYAALDPGGAGITAWR